MVMRYDVVVVGAGPGGSVAALTLARAGARVALVDKRGMPRDKACGDLIGPRGVRLLEELGIDLLGSRSLGDMVVVGPTGRRALLPALPGAGYADHAIAVPRARFDAVLHAAAVAAGAQPVTARVTGLLPPAREDQLAGGVRVSGGEELVADFVIGADGATSRLAELARLVDPNRLLWGFALRVYLDEPINLPHIVFWEPRPGRPLPGYGWLFPGPGGCANAGLGVGMTTDRTTSRRAGAELSAFGGRLRDLGVLSSKASIASLPRLGGWLKMGMVGTVPADRNMLLVGDAAGLVNPLQGEGIAPAMASGRAAAKAILAGPADAGLRYRGWLRTTQHHYHRAAAPMARAMVGHPRAAAAAVRLLTSPVVSPGISGAWSLYWNDLHHDAAPSGHRRLARTIDAVAHAATSRRAEQAWFDS